MAKGIINLKIIAALLTVAVLAGCSKKKDEVTALKQQLEETQTALDDSQRKCEALALDNRDLRVLRKNLNTQYSTVIDSTKSAEEQLNAYAQLIINLQLQIQELSTVVSEQEQIITQQEADLQEFMSMVGLTNDGQTTNNPTTPERTSTEY
jgi:chromosome segregation ATPase